MRGTFAATATAACLLGGQASAFMISTLPSPSCGGSQCSRLITLPSSSSCVGQAAKTKLYSTNNQSPQKKSSEDRMEEMMSSLQSRASQLRRQAELVREAREAAAASEGLMDEEDHLLTTAAGSDNENDNSKDTGARNSAAAVAAAATSTVMPSEEALIDCDWMPFHIRQALLRSRATVSSTDLDLLRRHVFGLESFYVTGEEVSTYPMAVLFKGNLRGRTPTDSMALIDHRMQSIPGLANRVSLFLLEGPYDDPSKVVSGEPTYSLLVVPSSISPDAAPLGIEAPALSFACLLASIVSSITFSYASLATNPEFFDKYVSVLDVGAILSHAGPIAGGLLAIQGLHEMAHVVMGKKYGLKLGWPLVLPSMEMGIFGAITPLASFARTRQALFDTALAGPLVALAASLAFFLLGLHLTPASFPEVSDATVLSGAVTGLADLANETPSAGLPLVPGVLIQQSFLLSSLSHALLPHLSLLGPSDNVAIHPLALIGFCGTIASAFNCLPVGRLDGGRAFASAFGRQMAARVSIIVLFVQAILCALSYSGLPLLFLWGLLITTLQKKPEVPPMDDVTEVDEGRQALMIGVLFLVFLTILPFPSGGQHL